MALRDYKIPATVTTTHFDRGFVKALDADGIDYFIFHNAVDMMGRHDFADLRMGSRVRLTPIQHPRGWRGIEVEILDL